MSESYINVLRTLYDKQYATVSAGKESRSFEIKRGVKQGDPISSLLFLAVMEVVFRSLKERWHRLNARRIGQYYGMVIDDFLEPLTNLRFADDVLLVAASKTDVSKMIADLGKEASQYGLKLHMGKTRVLTNQAVDAPIKLPCGPHEVQVLGMDEAEKYLGRNLATKDYHTTELSNRIASGWAAFFKFKHALCDRKLPLQDRIKLLEATVTPCVMYACAAWTMTADMEAQLKTTKRKMLRRMIRTTRDVNEAWPDYVRRATHFSEELAKRHGATDWVALQKAPKWHFAGRCAACSDGRWSKQLLSWKPWFRCDPKRNVGHPHKRWEDDFVKIAGPDWQTSAGRPDLWARLSDHN